MEVSQLDISHILGKFIQKENKNEIFFTFLVFHFDKSGKDFIDIQPVNKPSMLVTLLMSQFDISGNCVIELFIPKRYYISVILLVSHFDKLGKDNNFSHL